MKPIIFSTENVKALLDGRKTMARRVVKPQPTYWDDGERVYDKDNIAGPEFYAPVRVDKNGEQYPGKEVYGIYSDDGEYGCKAPCQPGDVLWVRETWAKNTDYADPALYIPHGFIHKATGEYHMGVKWRSPVTMPREAARLFLRVTDVRVERVQDISVEDVMAEGLPCDNEIRNPDPETHESIKNWNLSYAQMLYHDPWDARNAKRGHGWDSNPFVWVISFERLE